MEANEARSLGLSMHDVSLPAAPSRQPVSRPPLAAAGSASSAAQDVEFGGNFEGSKEEFENQRLDREEALRVSSMPLSNGTVLSEFACFPV
jgi:hypothetical protein